MAAAMPAIELAAAYMLFAAEVMLFGIPAMLGASVFWNAEFALGMTAATAGCCPGTSSLCMRGRRIGAGIWTRVGIRFYYTTLRRPTPFVPEQTCPDAKGHF
tara:strand:- start:16064 stop:16369 length:306 start_codon:yes stop_codon:yes gene_type:complete